PEQIFHISRSIELILGPIIGGIGTVVGLIVGAFVLTKVAETLSELLRWTGIDLPGIKQACYGFCLLGLAMFLPDGVWPARGRWLGLEGGQGDRASGEGER